MKLVLFGLSLVISLSGYTADKSEEVVAKPIAVKAVEDSAEKEIEKVVEDSSKQWAVYGTYAYADTWLPGKIGISGSYGDQSRVYELAIQQASYSFDVLIDDLGNITDRRIHLTTRSFTWDGSFNFQYGAYYNSLEVNLGNSYTGLVGDKFDVLKFETLGIMWGVGNRWGWDNGLSLGFDWFKIFWPLVTLSENTDFVDEVPAGSEKDDAEKLADAIAKLPTFTLAHFEIGYRF
jgi:hypothetical protein